MTLLACPVATVRASADAVWRLLTNPSSWPRFFDMALERVEPEGRAAVGQRIAASSRSFGRRWPVRFTVEAVDDSKRHLRMRTELPLGISLENDITVVPLKDGATRVTFA